MHDADEHQPPIDRLGTTLRYLFAALPLLLYVVMVVLMSGRVPMPYGSLGWVLADMGLGAAGLVLMRWRRRWPWRIALALALMTAVSTTAGGPGCVTYISLVTHRRWRQIVPVAVVTCLSMVVSSLLVGTSFATSAIGAAATGVVVIAVATVLGLYVRGRRDLAASERAAEAAAQRQRVEQAQLAERLQIAQEMHDVLAHRISLLAMLAGGLAYRKDLTPEQTREAALAIQENAHQSLNELRAVLGTLRRDGGPTGGRAGGTNGGPEGPQPTLDHLDTLFEEVRAAGQRVEVDDTIDCRERLPTQTGRHAYRIVQEALTNARKHAPGSRVTAELGGRPGEGLRIRVSNPAPPGPSAGPGSRLGLVGLAERTRMAGGTISHTVRHGRFILDARLPWEA
ncbi:histidine kinase [Nonomuraea sp. B5E05]|uniref:sensor histidine kinase n=1 Tax=Nonomuraea sp. B5E05 TaxID=3153569 RepID=UPI003260F2CF